jgi:hypothetical protein
MTSIAFSSMAVQLEMFDRMAMPPVIDDDPDEGESSFDLPPPVRVFVSAEELRIHPRPFPMTPRSVFDLGELAALTARPSRPSRETTAPRYVARIEIAEGVTRCMGAAYPARWTPEDEERERQRRARQKPPTPPKTAKTKSRKLVELVGDD